MKQLLAVLLLTTLASAVDPQGRHSWKVSNLRAPIATPEHITLDISNEHLTFADKKHRSLLEIPAGNVLQVMYTPVVFNRGGAVAKGMLTPPNCAGDPNGCAALFLLSATAALFMSPMHGRSHYIRITWTDQNVEQQLEFEIGKSDYQPLLDALKDLSGVKYVDLEAEGQRVQKELAQNADKAVPIHLDHGSRLGVYELLSGDYILVALTRSGNRADVYLFAPPNGQGPAPSNLKAVARAHLRPAPSTGTIEFKNGSQIASISVNGQVLNFIE